MPPSCYCGKSAPFNQCCRERHSGAKPATTAEELMRSRYSAFCCSDVDYLIQTHLPQLRGNNDAEEIRETMNSCQWHRLQILENTGSKSHDSVEFVAFYSKDGELGQIHEKSRFAEKEGRWYYIDGEQLPAIKLQRNDSCWCGSGKKYKKCCLLAQH